MAMLGPHLEPPDLIVFVRALSASSPHSGKGNRVLHQCPRSGNLSWEAPVNRPSRSHSYRHGSGKGSKRPIPPKPRRAARLGAFFAALFVAALTLSLCVHHHTAQLRSRLAAAQPTFHNSIDSSLGITSSDLADGLPATAAYFEQAASMTAAHAPNTGWPGVSAADADAFACHFFGRLGRLDFASWELQQPAALEALAVLRDLHPRGRCPVDAAEAAAAATVAAPEAAAAVSRQGRHVLSTASNAGTPPAFEGAGLGQAHDGSSSSSSDSPTSGASEAPTTLTAERGPAAATAANPATALAALTKAVSHLRSLACNPQGVATPPPFGTLKVDLLGSGDGDGGADAAALRPAGSFVAVRRLALAVMQQLWEEPGGVWRDALKEAAPALLGDFRAAQACGARQRPIMELLHVSKSGGTSVCQLARMAARKAHHFDQDGNCLQEHFYDEPKWTNFPDFTQKRPGVSLSRGGAPRRRCNMWPSYDCNEWLATPEVSCAQREAVLKKGGLDFFSNEHALHGSTGHPGSTHSCPQFETLVVMRPPMERVLSHIAHIITTFTGFGSSCASSTADRKPYHLTRNLTYWRTFAPAVVDNYFVRSLLGKHFHCMPAGGLSAEHLHQAQAKLLTLDHIVLLEEDGLSDVVFRLGLGWPKTLARTHLRSSGAVQRQRRGGGTAMDMDRANGFAPGSLALLTAWNALDQQLFGWGKVALKLDSAFLATTAVYNNQTWSGAAPPHLVAAAPPPPSAAAAAAAVQGGASRAAANAASARAAASRAKGLPSLAGHAAEVAGHTAEVAGHTAHVLHPDLPGFWWDAAHHRYVRGALKGGHVTAALHQGAAVAPRSSSAARLPVDLRILLFGAAARLGDGVGAAPGSGGGSAAHTPPKGGTSGTGKSATRGAREADAGLEFVCPDVSATDPRAGTELLRKAAAATPSGAAADSAQARLAATVESYRRGLALKPPAKPSVWANRT